ncbi:MAG: phosphoribosylformylglycinamidine synthase subunit PurL [Simkaniaceae bacterium]|nr:phosphoribosylformylglycinamidine synthase subunit PurL [Simkaniaceae bacterium]
MTMTNEILDFSGLSHDEIRALLNEYNIPLTPDEILKVQNEFLGRAPSLAECVLFSIEGSEHCSYKSSRPHLKQFVTDGPNVVLGAKEDAGVVAVTTDNEGHRWCIVMSHESHNHPSQIVPYEGAATGVGGNVRDVCCMGAEVIAVADALRFGDIKSNKTKWIHDGVVDGIGGYGNPLGIPNIGGDLYYHSGYNDNCLVNVVTLGIVREDRIFHSYAPENANGYDIILVGKPTDNSGFGGASFASLELEEEKKEQNKGAVQEPNAFLERHILKATNALFKILGEQGAVNRVGFKDLGAGGVACASVELADTTGYGAEIFMEKVHVSMENLHPSVTLCSETQERFMWVSPPDLTDFIVEHYNKTFDMPGVSDLAQARVIGKIRDDKQYVVHANGELIVNAPAEEVTKGFLYNRPYKKPERNFAEPNLPEPTDYNDILNQLLAHENIASRLPVYETYDKQVQGRTHIESGMADAGVMLPFNSDDYPEEIRKVAIALSTDHNPRYGEIDPYWAAVNAVVESMRNVAAVGAHPISMTDCLCFGNPEKPTQMWEFVEGVRGVAETCKNIHLYGHKNSPTPIIAGNVSFYNESKNGPIPASPIISCLGTMPDGQQSITQGFKSTGSMLIMVGKRKDECGGSTYYSLFGELGAKLPKPEAKEVEAQIHTIANLIQDGHVLAAHDISEGGIAVAIAEMTFDHGIGCDVTIPGDLRTDTLLFSQTGGFILEVDADDADFVKTVFSDSDVFADVIGRTTNSERIQIQEVVDIPVSKAKSAWENGLREKLL